MGREGAVFATAIVAALAGCTESAAVVCANGRLCPAGTVCLPDFTCFDAMSCGNGQIDPGEECDKDLVNRDCEMRSFDAYGSTCDARCRITRLSCSVGEAESATLRHGAVALWGNGTIAVAGKSEGLDYFDGTRWTLFPRSDDVKYPTAAWGTGPDDIWIGDDLGGRSHWDGSAWHHHVGDVSGRIGGLWGADASEVFAAHTGGVVRFRAGAWSAEAIPTDGIAYHDVWGSSSSDVFVVGDDGAILHFDGVVWRRQATPPISAPLQKVWGSGPGDVFALGTDVLLHFDGAQWDTMTPPAGPLVDVGGSAADDVYVASTRTIWRRDGTRWVPYAREPILAYESIWVDSYARIWAGVTGSVDEGPEWTNAIRRFGGADLAHAPAKYAAIWAASPRSYVATTLDSRIVRVDDGASDTGYDPHGPVYDLHGLAPDDVYAAGSFGIQHFDGNEWEEDDPRTAVYRLWSLGSDLYACGKAGIGHREGRMAWSWVPFEQAEYCSDGWASSVADVYVIASGDLFRWDGAAWTRQRWVNQPRAIWGWARDDVYAIDGSLLLHYDGATARVVLRLLGGTYSHVASIAPDDMYVMSSDGEAYHFDGRQWSRTAGFPGGIQAVAGAPGRLFLARFDALTTLSYSPRRSLSCGPVTSNDIDENFDGTIDEDDASCVAKETP